MWLQLKVRLTEFSRFEFQCPVTQLDWVAPSTRYWARPTKAVASTALATTANPLESPPRRPLRQLQDVQLLRVHWQDEWNCLHFRFEEHLYARLLRRHWVERRAGPSWDHNYLQNDWDRLLQRETAQQSWTREDYRQLGCHACSSSTTPSWLLPAQLRRPAPPVNLYNIEN